MKKKPSTFSKTRTKKPLPCRLNSRMRRKIVREKRFSTSDYSEGRKPAPAVNVNLSFDTLPYRLDGVSIKRSERWCNGPKIISSYQIPYINRLGKFTGSSFATVRCSPSQYVATVVATLLARLKSFALRHQGHSVVVRNKVLLAKAAYYYAVSKNNWFHDRLIALIHNLEKNKKAIRGLLKRFMSKMDDYTRFVYSQVNFQTNWLFSRAGWPRDKSIFFERSVQFLRDSKGFEQSYMQWRAFRLTSVRMSHLCPPRFSSVSKTKP